MGEIKVNKFYRTIRYGVWDWGWESYEGKPMFGFYRSYYDGDWYAFHLYKFWIGVWY